jgi:hypothetical protein
MSHLLIDERPMMALPSLANKIGIDNAIVLQQINYWIRLHEESGNERCFHLGRWWVFNTIEQWQEKQFTWWSVETVKRIISTLEKMGLLVSDTFNVKACDRKKWYTIDRDTVDSLATIEESCVGRSRVELIKAVKAAKINHQVNLTQGSPGQSDPMVGVNLTQFSGSNSANDLYKETKEETKEETASTSEAIESGGRASQRENFQDGCPEGSESSDQGSAKSKSSRLQDRKKKRVGSPPAFSTHYPDECLKLYRDHWSPMFVELRGGLDSRKLFCEGFDILIEEGIELDVIVQGTEYYCKAKMDAIAAGKQPVMPPDAERYFLGKGGGESYCLRAYELLQSKVGNSTSVTNIQSLDKSIRVELERLGMYGVLPPEWKLKTGKNKPSELTDEQKAEYLNYLRSLQSKTEAA